MMLSELLTGLADVDKDMAINGLSLDSRTVTTGNAFIALAGANQHGLSHAGQAIKNGASVVIFEPTPAIASVAENIVDVPVLAVPDLALKLGEIAARFYGQPSQALSVIGITGTNGKTSCSQFLSQALGRCGIIGTLGWGVWGRLQQTLNTTPDALAVQAMLAQLKVDGNDTVAMEVSSHGLAQGRVNGVHFKGAVFTNISRDHLDYHGTMEDYLQAKLGLLAAPGLAFAAINLDDPYSGKILAAVPSPVVTWGISTKNSAAPVAHLLSAENISHQVGGIGFDVRWQGAVERINVPLYGDFNIENVLLVLATLLAMGIGLADAASRLAQIKPVTGRMERFGDGQSPLVFVDYAHTPDALNKVLASARKHCQQDLWVVFGCGGNRDTGKRPQMGACAEQWADHVIVTDDNPRFENAQDIVNGILVGCHSDKVRVIANRSHAIEFAVTQAEVGDCVVIAGKGHEEYQEINGVRLPFSDSASVMTALTMRTKDCEHVVE